jgi:hypothetical protein
VPPSKTPAAQLPDSGHRRPDHVRQREPSPEPDFTDQALINLARLVNKAVRAMLHARDILAPDTD